MCKKAGNFRTGGLQDACFTADGQGVLTVSKTGIISCWEWRYSAFGKSKANAAVESYKSRFSKMKGIINDENKLMESLPPVNVKTGFIFCYGESSPDAFFAKTSGLPI